MLVCLFALLTLFYMGKKAPIQKETASIPTQQGPTGGVQTGTGQIPQADEFDRQNYTLIQNEKIPQDKKPKDAGEVQAVTYAYKAGGRYLQNQTEGLIKNMTEHTSAQVKAFGNQKMPVQLPQTPTEPQVLIYHTHTSESYESFDLGYYNKSAPTRTQEESKNMVAVGKAIAAQLNQSGIPTLHDTQIHDKTYTGAYDVSRKSVQQILKENPSIQLVLDIHRDAIEDESGVRYKPTANILQKNAAQIMMIVGCDGDGVSLPNFAKNLAFATRLQTKLETMYPGLTRPLLFDYRHYNQDLAKASLLIEIGSHANTLSEAVYAGELVGNALVNLLKSPV